MVFESTDNRNGTMKLKLMFQKWMFETSLCMKNKCTIIFSKLPLLSWILEMKRSYCCPFVKMIILSDDNIKLNLPYLISIDVKECLIIFKCPEWRLLSLSC